jgi:pyruvate dehydrogenase E2 component (dihydrolipoamide acetyltransferase)
MIKEIKIPEIGEKVESGSVIELLVKEGDAVEVDQSLIEFETDKAVVEIPSPEKGTITEILVKAGQEVKIGEAIAKIDTNSSAPPKKEEAKEEDKVEEEPEKESKPTPEAPAKKEAATAKAEPAEPSPDLSSSEGDASGEAAPASPSVRRLARELGADINKVAGTGPGGRITDEDVKRHVKQLVTGAAGRGAAPGFATPELPDFSAFGEIERKPMSHVRRLTMDSMSLAWRTIPHVTQFDRADITELETVRKKFGKAAEKDGTKLTITSMLLKVVAAALKKFPAFNASIDEANNQIILKKYIHVGIAVDTDRGLLVPVIRDVDKKSILELAKNLQDVSDRSRNKKVQPDEFEGGSFTISNQGSIGGTDFTPIVYWPQVAILGVSRGMVEPRYIDGELKPRNILPLSLSYDHRAVDGADAARFLTWVKNALEHPILIHFDA